MIGYPKLSRSPTLICLARFEFVQNVLIRQYFPAPNMRQNRGVNIELRKPYVVFIGEETSPVYTKTGSGIAHWRADSCLGQIRLSNDAADLNLPELSLDEAVTAGAATLIVGVAVVGGTIPDSMRLIIRDALSRGVDVASGMHDRLSEDAEFAAVAEASGAKIIDVRVPPPGITVGSGKKRSGKRLLTVGTDCALGKKYTALAIAKEMNRRGMDAAFRATGQTGILISGGGIPIDAVVSDFVSGAAEQLSPSAADNHWDVIEGQGALLHPGFAAVSTGLLLGSQPDALVVCSDATREKVFGWPDFPLPSIDEIIELSIRIGSVVNPAVRVVGVSINTSELSDHQRAEYLNSLEKKYGVPCVDPIATGVGRVVDSLESTK